MPASPITKEVALPNNWVQLQKIIIPDSNTSSYWSVWYNADNFGVIEPNAKGTAWLMCCPFGDDPSINDSWGHAEEIDNSCRNVLTTIESVYKVSFLESIWVEMGTGNELPSGPVAIGRGETWDGE